MKFNRKILSGNQPTKKYISKKRLREDEIDFDELRSYRLDRLRNELKKNNIEACILFDPVNVRYCLLYTSPSPRDLSTSRMPSSA